MARLTLSASQGDTVSVRLTNYALDETPEGIVLRGVLDLSTLSEILVDKYQREVIPQVGRKRSIIAAMRAGARVPDVELGMRGDHFDVEGDYICLLDPTFVVDGLQRISSAKVVYADGTAQPHIGATIHFDTTEDWERLRFKTLNQDRARIHTNILLRNKEAESPAIAVLLYLCKTDKTFVMNGRVCWNQQMSKGELITAVTLTKVIGRLLIHLGPTGNSEVDLLAAGLDTTMAKITKAAFRDNVKLFFDILDRMYGVKRVTYTRGAVYMRGTFLLALAKLLSNHTDFWKDDKRLTIEPSLLRKLGSFPVTDPQVIQLASSSGKAIDMLYLLMVEHINSGKSTRLNSSH
jgi:hypothetical protein